MPTPVEIPKRSLFRAAEVCEIAGLQSYVLRSWETEFPDLGVAKSAGGPRLYRRSDVERVLQIKQLVFGEGLTLAGVRKRLGETKPEGPDEGGSLDDLLRRDARERLIRVREGLRSLLNMLSTGLADPGFELTRPDKAPGGKVRVASTPTPQRRAQKPVRRKRAHA